MSTRLGIFIVVAITVVCGSAYAQGTDNSFAAKGFQPNREYFSATPTEHIDTLSGNLVLTYTDLVLPGNAGHDLRFQRSFNAKNGRWIFGVVGIPRLSDGGPNPPSFFDATGAEHRTIVVARDTTVTPNDRWVATSEFWLYDRFSRRLYFPDSSIVSYDTSFRPVLVTDAFDNSINIRYPNTAPPLEACPVATCIDQHLGLSGAARHFQLTATLNADSGGFPSSLTFLGANGQADRVWTYHLDAPVFGLSRVESPVGTSWDYSYVGNPASEPYSITTTSPQGGVTGYDFKQHRWWYMVDQSQCPTCSATMQTEFMAVIWHRTILDKTWTYTFDFGNAEAATQSYTTTMDAPDQSHTTYRYASEDGTSLCGGGAGGGLFPGASEVSLCSRTLVSEQGQVDRESYEYQWIPTARLAPTGFQYYSPEMHRRTITRDGRVYTTQWDFHASNYGDFHQPYQMSEAGEASRTTTSEFVHSSSYGFDQIPTLGSSHAMIGSRLSRQTITANGQIASRTWTYNADTAFLEEQVQYGLRTSYENDGHGNVKKETKGDGTVTEFTYDWGVVQNTQTAAYTVGRVINPDGTVRSETRGSRTTQFEYDGLSRVTRTVPPGASNEIVTAYIGGNQIQVTRGGSVTTTTLDGFGRPIRVDSPATSVVTAYDEFGRKKSESLPFIGTNAPLTSFVYDPLGRLTTRTNPGGTHVEYAYPPGSVEVLDENGHRTIQRYKAFGTPDDKLLSEVTDAYSNTWLYDYTVLGALTRVTAPGGMVREWRYDRPGFPSQLGHEIHPESGTVTYSDYDGAGRLTQKKDARGKMFTYSYDNNGRLKAINADGRLTTIGYEAGTDNRDAANADGIETITKYDTAGRLKSRVDRIPGFTDLVQAFEYDGNDNLTLVTYASTRRIQYSYNAANQVTAVTDISTPGSPRVFASGFQYHPSGAIASYATPGMTHSTQFDPNRYWPTRITAGSLDLQYQTYDGAGNVGLIVDSRAGMNQSLHYDWLDRLTGMDGTGGYPAVSYAYDAHGNRISNSASTYCYDGRPECATGGARLTRQNGVDFSYDPNGNLESSTYQGASYTYTPDNQVETSTVDGIAASYRYDADGWRIAKASGLTSLYARGVNGQLLTERRPQMTRDYIYVGSKLLGMIKRQEDGPAAPYVRQVTATQDPGGIARIGFIADSPTSVALQRADLERALQTGACTVANDAGCSWTTVASQAAPTNSISWTNSTSLTDTPTAGAYLYTVSVTDTNGASSTGAIVAVDTTDASPDSFGFANQSGVAVNAVVSSNIVQITGLAGHISISVAGGAYRVCGDASCSANPVFITAASTITDGSYLQLRTMASSTVNSIVSTTVTVGVAASTWTVTTADQDATPDSFGFTDQAAVASSTPITSNIIPITGIAGNIAVSITGVGTYRVCTDASCVSNPTFISGATTITNGAYLQLRITSSATASTAVSTSVTVGTVTSTWTVTTDAPQDLTPNAFDFVNQTGVAVSTVTDSSVLQITGITGNVGVTLSGGNASFRVCADAACSTNPAFGNGGSTIGNGQYLQLRIMSSASFSASVSTTVTVGTVSDGWSVTTLAQDTTPNAFAFTNQSGIPVSTVVSSDTIQVSGITGSVSVSISGGNVGKFRVCPNSTCNGVAFQTAASTISNGQYLGLQQTSSGTNGATVIETVTVGTFSAQWAVTSVPDPCAGAPPTVVTCADGSIFAGYSPATGTKMYTTPNDYPGDLQFAWPQDPYGYNSWVDGLYNTNGLAVVGNHPAAAACYYLTAHGKSDWYLPAPNEMEALDPNRNAIGGFKPDGTDYWTSTEQGGPGAIYHRMGTTFDGYTGMGISMPVRCVRRD